MVQMVSRISSDFFPKRNGIASQDGAVYKVLEFILLHPCTSGLGNRPVARTLGVVVSIQKKSNYKLLGR
jgi:hypothetical protein